MTYTSSYSVRSLVRILKKMRGHVPGLSNLNVWYIELLVSIVLLGGISNTNIDYIYIH